MASVAFPRKHNSDFSNCLDFIWSWKDWAFFSPFGHISLCIWFLFTDVLPQQMSGEIKMSENMGKEVVSFLIVFLSRLVRFVPTATDSRAVTLAQNYGIEVTLLEQQKWERGCKGRELSLQLWAESLMSRSFLIIVQCIFEALQSWCLSAFPALCPWVSLVLLP